MKRKRVDLGAPSTDEDRARLEELFAARQFPGTKGLDSTFLEGDCNGSQFEKVPFIGDYYRKKAQQAGVSITGKKYISQLARYAGDPAAWVSGMGDVNRIARERNLTVRDGHQGHEVPPPKPIGLAQDIVDGHVNKIIKEDPSKAKKRAQVEAEVRDLHTPPHKRGLL